MKERKHNENPYHISYENYLDTPGLRQFQMLLNAPKP